MRQYDNNEVQQRKAIRICHVRNPEAAYVT